MASPSLLQKPVEVSFKMDQQKAIIEGKTSVPFQAFVQLILQRKVFPLFRQWGKEPVVIGSELLTGIASAPQDSQENRTRLVLVTLGLGTVVGIFLFSALQLSLSFLDITLSQREFLVILGSIAGLSLIGFLLGKVQVSRGGDQVAETIEKIASMVGK